MATWNIKYQPHGKIVTCQRPIVLTLTVTAGAVAHFRGVLYVKSGANWVNTDIQLNAYTDSGSSDFSCNVAEYCRNHFTENEALYNPNQWCSNLVSMVEREFKVIFYPVEYDASGNLVPNPSDTEETNTFFVIPTNTEARESTSSVNDNIRLDKFVLNGGNSSSAPWFSSAENRLLSNMPDYNTIDVSQGFFFYYNSLQISVAGRTPVLEITDGAGAVQTLDLGTSVDGYAYLHTHPVMVDFMLSLQAGVVVNFLTDAAGNLATTTAKFQIKFNDTATGAFIRSSPAHKVRYKDGMGCVSKTFIFRNMRGGFDHFTATGTQDRSVEFSGTEFDRHTRFERSDATFDLLRGQHNITNLWGSRKDTFSVFTQKVSKEYAIWLEELISSPQVWIVEDIKDFQSSGTAIGYDNKGLVAINILKGSYKVFNTENNMHYIEFKYTLSENTITQKM
tara:strand:+ start:1164 stop:2510 length:1347 start_codon:yes stop_codon:yes gene_type:complete